MDKTQVTKLWRLKLIAAVNEERDKHTARISKLERVLKTVKNDLEAVLCKVESAMEIKNENRN